MSINKALRPWEPRAALVIIMLSLLPAPSNGQNATTSGSFEVASIKASAPDDGGLRMGVWGNPQPGGRWVSRNVTLDKIIRAAYPGHGLKEQLVGGPDWVRTDEFDINARALNEKAGREELTAMARRLLADRFKLVLRTEVRETSGYAITLARNGALRAADLDCESLRAATIRGETMPPASASACRVILTQNGSVWRLQAGGIDMNRLAELLTPHAGAPVVDATGLKGQFDIKLESAADPNSEPGTQPVSFFTALQEQLGLRLERRRVPMEVLVIAHVEPPTPD